MSQRLGDLDVESWKENRKVVLDGLQRVERAVDTLNLKVGSEMTDMKVELATIKTKVALYAAVISLVASLILSAVISYLMKR